MHYSCQALLLAALALETAIATPHLRHLHLHERAPTANDGWTSTVDWTKVQYTQWPSAQGASGAQAKDKIQIANSPPETGPTSTPAATAPSSTAKVSSGSSGSQSSGGSGSCLDISQVWKQQDPTPPNGRNVPVAADHASSPWTDKGVLPSVSKEKRGTDAENADKGNVGDPVYGSNMIPLSNCNDESHAYTIKFTNSKGSDTTMALWNKYSADNDPFGGQATRSFFYFDLPAGKSVAFAIGENSHIAWSEAGAVCPRNEGNAWGCIFGEANIAHGGTTGWDVSAVWSTIGKMLITTSTQDGTSSSNAGCYYPPGTGADFATGNPVYPQKNGVSGCNPNSKESAVHLHAQFGVDS